MRDLTVEHLRIILRNFIVFEKYSENILFNDLKNQAEGRYQIKKWSGPSWEHSCLLLSKDWKRDVGINLTLACIEIIQQSLMGNIPCCEQSRPLKAGEVGLAGKKQVRFNAHLNPSHRQNTDENAQSSKSPPTPNPSHNLTSSPPKTPSRGPENYQSRKYLGRGDFGCVVLAEQKQTGRLFAMKIIQKSKIKEFNVMQSRLVQQVGQKEFLVGIRETFQNQHNIYIVMEYLPMGDLYFYLRKKEIPFPEALVRAVIAEIVVGITILHSFGIVYRELKPENLLITEDGHIKLTDYGLSKIIIENKKSVSTFVGSLEYMPPETLKGSGEFGQKGDLWALGVLMFQLLFRESPFGGSDWRESLSVEDYKLALQSKVLNQRINSKIGYMSSGFRDLLLRLLEKDPEKRIDLGEIRSHDFFKDVDWKKVENRQNPAPLKDVIQKHDSITFRDATNQEYNRKRFVKHRPRDNFEIRLFQFRNSQ